MYCNACGKAIPDDARFCAYCGRVTGLSAAPKRLVRPRANRTVAGVCAGLAEHLEMDVTLFRLIWVFVVIMSGIFPGIFVYVLAWIIIPEEPEWSPAGAGQPVTIP